MKKIVLLILSAALFLLCSCSNVIQNGEDQPKATEATSAHETPNTPSDEEISAPPCSMQIEGWSKLTDLENALKTKNEEELLLYLSDNYRYSGTTPVEDISALLKLAENLPIPTRNGSKEECIIKFYMEEPSLHVLYQIDGENCWYRFEFVLNEEVERSIRASILKQDAIVSPESIIQADSSVKILKQLAAVDNPNFSHIIQYWLEIDGFLVAGVYKNVNMDVYAASVSDIFKDIHLSSKK